VPRGGTRSEPCGGAAGLQAAAEEAIPRETPALCDAAVLLQLSAAPMPPVEPDGFAPHPLAPGARGAPCTAEDAAGALLDEILPALACALVDDLIREREVCPWSH
jgi:hypothetical protein